MSGFLMKPKVDFAFKEIMMDEKARTGFLAAVLDIKPEDIKETQILNTNLRKLHENDKLGILDMRLLLNNNTEIDTEVQLSELEVWPDRSLFYTSKMFTEQIEKGQKYDVFKKCVSISILGFKLFKEETSFYSRFHIREDTRNFIYTDNKQKCLEYEARQKALFDYNQFMYEAEQRGKKEGMEKGRETERMEIAKNLIVLGYPVNEIIKITGLSAGMIDEIKLLQS